MGKETRRKPLQEKKFVINQGGLRSLSSLTSRLNKRFSIWDGIQFNEAVVQLWNYTKTIIRLRLSKYSHLPSKLRFSANYSFFGLSAADIISRHTSRLKGFIYWILRELQKDWKAWMGRVCILSIPHSFRGAKQLYVFSLFMFSCSVAGLLYVGMLLFCLYKCSIKCYVKNFLRTFEIDVLRDKNLSLFLLNSVCISFSTNQLLTRCDIFVFFMQINFLNVIKGH